MAGPNYTLDKGFIVDAAAAQFSLVKLVTGSQDHVTPTTAAGDIAIGVLQQAVAAGDAGTQVADVRIMGISKCIAIGALASGIGQRVGPGATAGQVATAAPSAGTAQTGIALSQSGAAGDWIDVLLTPGATA